MSMIAKRQFISPILGNVLQGHQLDVDPTSGLGRHLAENGLAEAAKAVREEPGVDYDHKAGAGIPTDAGAVDESSSSPAVQAPTKPKRGRPRKYPKAD